MGEKSQFYPQKPLNKDVSGVEMVFESHHGSAAKAHRKPLFCA